MCTVFRSMVDRKGNEKLKNRKEEKKKSKKKA